MRNGKSWKTPTSILKQDDMWLFKKQKKKTETASAVTDKIAGKIARAGIIVQSRFANSMNKIFTGMNVKRLKLLLIIFCRFFLTRIS